MGSQNVWRVPDSGLKGRWSSLFGIKPTSKSSFPKIKEISYKYKGMFVMEILDELVDHNIASMASSLVGKFIGPRPNIDIVRTHVRNKWDLKGYVEIESMAKGFLSFEFSCMEDLTRIL